VDGGRRPADLLGGCAVRRKYSGGADAFAPTINGFIVYRDPDSPSALVYLSDFYQATAPPQFYYTIEGQNRYGTIQTNRPETTQADT
jgi:hypothetical protein